MIKYDRNKVKIRNANFEYFTQAQMKI